MCAKLKELLSLKRSKNPGSYVLAIIILGNVGFFLVAASVIKFIAAGTSNPIGFGEAIFDTISMILDAGCIQFIVSDVKSAGAVLVVVCILVIIIGMLLFTGAAIGYLSNRISEFIDESKNGSRKISVSEHVVILNWNTRASEIVNDLLYCETKQKVVVLVNSRKEEIEKEIDERLSDTINRENRRLRDACKDMGLIKGSWHYRKNRCRRNVTVIVREGDVFSSKQLRDISLEKARIVIILGGDINNTVCKFEHLEKASQREHGNSLTVKTLMQVADITSAETSLDKQKIIVEITDEWTRELVEKIKRCKQVDGKCNIIPVNINRILGQILSQFSLMPELNLAYSDLFSNRGATFFSVDQEYKDDSEFIPQYLASHKSAIPLTFMKHEEKGAEYHTAYYSARSATDIAKVNTVRRSDYKVDYDPDYWIEKKTVIILGHNSKCHEIMEGFNSFRDEWNSRGNEKDLHILSVIVIDDEESLKKLNNYEKYNDFVRTVPASIYDRDTICSTINKIVSENQEDTSVLILSDDAVLNEDIDANALANLVYVQDIIKDKMADPDFDPESIDIIVEIIDPKHHDIVNSYSIDAGNNRNRANNVVISNRYISKMITQIGEKEELYNFYIDILKYDSLDDEDAEYDSKEIYTKKVSRLFKKCPGPCTAEELIRAVYEATSTIPASDGKINPAIVLGYVKPGGEMVLFEGDQSNIKVELSENDKIIVFSNH